MSHHESSSVISLSCACVPSAHHAPSTRHVALTHCVCKASIMCMCAVPQDGFTHLSKDTSLLCAIGNQFYKASVGDWLLLCLDAARLTAKVLPAHYPRAHIHVHIYCHCYCCTPDSQGTHRASSMCTATAIATAAHLTAKVHTAATAAVRLTGKGTRPASCTCTAQRPLRLLCS